MGYYGMIQPHLKRRDELAHGRTKGSRNGVSNTPGYNAIGKKAIGRRLPDGTYVYDDPTMMQKSMDARMQNAQNMQNMQRGLGNLPGPAQQQRQQAANILKNVTSRQSQQNLNPLQRAGQAMSGWANQAGQNISGWAGGLADKAKSAAGTVGGWLGDRWNNLGEAANKWGGGLARTAQGAVRGAKDVGRNVGNWLGNRGREAWDAYSNSPLGELDRRAVGAVKNAGQAIGRAAGKAGEAIGGAANQAGRAVSDAAGKAGKAVKGAYYDVFGGNPNVEAENIERMQRGEALKDNRGLVGKARDAIGSAAGKAGEAIGGAVNNAGQTIGNMAGRAGQAIGNIPGNVKQFVDDRAYDIAGNRSFDDVLQKQGVMESKLNDMAMKEQALDAVRGTNREAAALEAYRQSQKDYEKARHEYERSAKSYDQPNLIDATNFIGTMFNGNKKKKK